MTDGGGIFYSTHAIQLYDMLGIRKERIDPGEPWENYAETLFSIQRRLADHAFSNARTWPEIQQAHQIWWTNYNTEHHYAHRERQDGRHSPSDVLRGVLGRTYPEEVLSRVLYATQFTRHLDKHGYVRFKHWRLFGENGLAGEEVSVWVYESTLKIEYQTTALSLYSVRLSPDQQDHGSNESSPPGDAFSQSTARPVAALRYRVAARVAAARAGRPAKRGKIVELARHFRSRSLVRSG